VFVVMVTPECAPAAKAGGLGDAVAGLSRELELRGNAVEITLPKYAAMRYDGIWDVQPSYRDPWVPWYDGTVRCTVWFGHANGRKCFFFEPHAAANFFGRGRLYGYGRRFRAVRLLFRRGRRVHARDRQAAGHHPLPRLADRTGPSAAARAAAAPGHASVCLRTDYSWARPGQEYLDIYHHIRRPRGGGEQREQEHR
jgi:hypothetical protein